jgi:hypothetical protein
MPLMQFTRLTKSPTTNIGLSNNHAPSLASSKIATLPGKGSNAANSINGGKAGKNLPVKNPSEKSNGSPLRGKSQFHDSGAPRRFGGGIGASSGPRFTQSRGSFGSMGRGGGFRR